ncbi:hypothetical protein Pelo_12900 [Pelomyxa schiedti]|nr:hypothetical protein Pelo_12900 [Pelomyxa schiedti]
MLEYALFYGPSALFGLSIALTFALHFTTGIGPFNSHATLGRVPFISDTIATGLGRCIGTSLVGTSTTLLAAGCLVKSWQLRCAGVERSRGVAWCGVLGLYSLTVALAFPSGYLLHTVSAVFYFGLCGRYMSLVVKAEKMLSDVNSDARLLRRMCHSLYWLCLICLVLSSLLCFPFPIFGEICAPCEIVAQLCLLVFLGSHGVDIQGKHLHFKVTPIN